MTKYQRRAYSRLMHADWVLLGRPSCLHELHRMYDYDQFPLREVEALIVAGERIRSETDNPRAPSAVQ